MAQVNAVIMLNEESRAKLKDIQASLQVNQTDLDEAQNKDYLAGTWLESILQVKNMSLETKMEGNFLHLVWTYDVQESKSKNKDMALLHTILAETDAQEAVENKLQKLGLPFFLYDELAYDNEITLSDMAGCIGKEALFRHICKLEDAAERAHMTVMGRALDEDLYEAIRVTINFAKKAFLA